MLGITALPLHPQSATTSLALRATSMSISAVLVFVAEKSLPFYDSSRGRARVWSVVLGHSLLADTRGFISRANSMESPAVQRA